MAGFPLPEQFHSITFAVYTVASLRRRLPTGNGFKFIVQQCNATIAHTELYTAWTVTKKIQYNLLHKERCVKLPHAKTKREMRHALARITKERWE